MPDPELDFFFDPVCPWAWITSRWVSEVKQIRDYDVRWRFISLYFVNDDNKAEWYTPEYRAGHYVGLQCLRVADEVRLTLDNDAVGRLYTVLGTAFHPGKRRDEFKESPVDFMKSALNDAGLDPALASHVDDESHDAYIRSETDLAISRAGKDLGTPILTFHPGQDDEGSFFGPVMPRIPRGEEAVKLWDAIEIVATSCGMAELKRAHRGRPNFD